MRSTNWMARMGQLLICLGSSIVVLPTAAVAQTNLQAELGALQKRASALEARLDSPDQSTVNQAGLDYKAYVSDFKAFATKYRLTSRTRRISRVVLSPTLTVAQADHDKRVPNSPGGCPWITETATEQCVRTNTTKDYCDYFCVDIPPSGGKVTKVDPNADPTKQ
jgi:hypothetical protein